VSDSGQLPSLDAIFRHLRNRFEELYPICEQRNPWIFLCASAFVGLLSKLVKGSDRADSYQEFVQQYFPERYSTFKYADGSQDLPRQMYHVLRCGLVHSMSFIPDDLARRKGGRDRSVVLSHRQGSQVTFGQLVAEPPGEYFAGITDDAELSDERHLSNYRAEYAPDAAILVAEHFLEDVKYALEKVIVMASKDAGFGQTLRERVAKHPPLSGRFESGEI